MSNEIKKYCFTGITLDGEPCSAQTLEILGFDGVDVSCVEGLCVSFSLSEGAAKHCITVKIDCKSCDCPPIIETKCFCEDSDDCPNGCEYCNSEGVCVSFCPDGKVCEDETCSDCSSDDDCLCNQNCVQGNCVCPPSAPIINAAGCCVECSQNSHCDPCEVCIGGNCVPKDCQDGHCNPITGECDECYTNAHCGDNECCVLGVCVCCDGFHRDPLTGLCVETPDCFTSEDCKDCEDCVNYNCVPRICPKPDQICVNDTCVDGCSDPDDCPTGYGCLNGQCVPCNTLTCSGGISFCEQALGCECIDNTCQYIDCTILEDCVKWDVIRPTVIPGTPVQGTGLPAVAFNVTWVDLGLVQMPGGGLFRNYRFTITETSGATGIYRTYGHVLGTGNSVSFELDDATPIQWNNVGFEIDFQESPGSRTASIAIANTNWYSPDGGLTENLFITPANWSVNVQAAAIPVSTIGGGTTPGSLTLCPCNPNAVITGWNWNTIEGNLTVTFSPLNDGCLRATVQGCGIGEGTVTIDCAVFVSTIPLPPLPFDYSSTTCCDPITDPTCTGNPGDSTPCQVVDVLQGKIVLTQFGSVTPSGAGLYRGVFQPDSIGISIFDWIRAARNVCWSTTGTMTDVTAFAIPSLNFLFHDVEYTLGNGCLRMGYNCSIRVGPCKEVKAEVCLEGCEAFIVNIFDNDGTLTAITSLGNSVQLLYNWFTNSTPPVIGNYPDASAVSNTSTYVLPDPNTSVNLVTLNVKISVNGVDCYDQDILVFVLDAVTGCRIASACNYNANATVDGTCCYLENVTYSCSSGLNIPNACAGTDYYVIASPSNIPYTTPGLYLSPGIHTVIGKVGGVEVCRTTIGVHQCYRCVDGLCTAAPMNTNYGDYSTPDCNYECGCNLNIDINHSCNGNQSAIIVTIYEGSGSYNVTITNDIGTVLYGPVNTTEGVPVVSPAFCGTDYLILVNDNAGIPGACPTRGYHTNCFDCEDSQTQIIAYTNPFNGTVQYSCETERFLFSIQPDPCATSYTVEVVKNTDLNTVLATGNWGNLGVTTQTSLGLDDACNGDYTLTIEDSNGCSSSILATVNCDFCGDPIPDCPLVSFTPFVWPDIDTYQIGYNLEIAAATPTYTYVFEIWSTTNPTGPGCGGTAASLVYTISSPMPGGVYSGFLPIGDTFDWPVIQTCYIVKVRGSAPLGPDCFLETLVTVTPPSIPAPSCNVISYNVSTYNTVAQNFSLSWNFVNSSGDITLEAVVWDSGTCGVGSSTTSTISGLPSIDTNHTFDIAQIDGVAQCVEFHIFDTANPACGTDIVERTVAACTCSVTLDEIIYNVAEERIEIEWSSVCGSGDGFTIEIIERGAIGCTGSTSALTSYSVSGESGLQYHTITAPGADRYIEVIITDDTNGACTDTGCVVVTGCNDCTEQFVDIPASSLSSLEDSNGNVYLIPASVFFECVDTGDPSVQNDTAVAALEDHLVALGDCGTPVVTWESIVPDITTCLKSSITYITGGTSTFKYLGIDINGTLYSTDITWGNAVSGVVTLLPASENLIEDHILDSLNAENIPFSDIQASVTSPGVNSGKLDIVIQGVDITEVLTGHYDSTATPGTNTDLFDTTGCADLGENATDGTCIRLTISGSGIIFANADVDNNSYTFDNSGC
jgi:hypothetical protein